MNNRLAGILFFSSVVLCTGTTARAQDADSLVQKEQLLRQENGRYIRMAQKDGTLSSSEADSLRTLCSGTVEKPIQASIDLLFQIRDYIDHRYDEQLQVVNEAVMKEHYFSANTMLPAKLGMPEGYVSPEEREEARQKLAMEQMAASIALDFEKEKLPAWQEWWIRHIPFFFGSRAWYKRKTTFIGGHEVAVPPGAPGK